MISSSKCPRLYKKRGRKKLKKFNEVNVLTYTRETKYTVVLNINNSNSKYWGDLIWNITTRPQVSAVKY